MTIASQVTVSHQLVDRAGPTGVTTLLTQQLHRDWSVQANTYVLTQALANAGSVSYTGTFGVVGTSGAGTSFVSKVGAAKNALRVTSGQQGLLPTNLFVKPARAEYSQAWGDTNGRPC